MNKFVVVSSLIFGLAPFMAGCSLYTASIQPLPSNDVDVTAIWHAPLLKSEAAPNLTNWWAMFDDPLLIKLVNAGQGANPTLAQAKVTISNALAVQTMRGAYLLPSVDIGSNIFRGRPDLTMPLATSSTAAIGFNWEMDIWGANKAALKAAKARVEASQANWHASKISIAAEIANAYVDFRACEAKLNLANNNAKSLRKIAHLSNYLEANGLRSSAEVNYAQANAAQSEVLREKLKSVCEIQFKSIVSLTSLKDDELRRELAIKTSEIPIPRQFEIPLVPAEVLANRPDIYAAERDVIATLEDFIQTRKLRLPRVGLSGSIGTSSISSGGITTDGTVWSVGPISISFPIFDGGIRKTNTQAALTRYEVSSIVYAFRVREAVREVETALISIQSLSIRNEGADTAVAGFERSFKAVETGYQIGTNSLFELEESRLKLVSAQDALVEIKREKVIAWISLYRAIGSGWSSSEVDFKQNPINVSLSAPSNKLIY